jgi:hypothetical protein
MAIIVNSVSSTNAMPSAPQRLTVINVDMDASYPTGGESIVASLPDGATVKWSETVGAYNGTVKRWFRVSAAGKIQAFADTNGVVGAEASAAADLSLYVGVSIAVITE